ncbi:hypothetical protein [Acidipila rosea]|uniref:Uncharacterized protein n=1 Tax=Acidipila rosea TaxID=768535 RepID=A0A4V2PV33_9BACT|nr:hypothetical protein [Acidipila rosea]TCK72801.1 hypothetical protein C7378_2391 [Acidipila rosea]
MRKRTRITILVAAVILVLLVVAVYLRKKAPPEVARLLPESDGIVYLNLRPLRAATHFDQRQVPHDPDYQKFIDATGIVFERDLDEAAFALHRRPDPFGPNGPVAFSEVFDGRFDGHRLTNYLAGVAASQEKYAGHTIYNVPSDGRTVRVVLLGYDMVAISNTPTSEQIHSMIDRYRTAALPFSGSTLLAQHYADVPLLSLAWGVGQIGLPLGQEGGIRIMGIRLPLAVDATFIASLRWTGSIRLRIEEIAPTEGAATASAESIKALVSIFRAAENNLPGSLTDADTAALLNSTKVVHYKDRAVLTATLPPTLLQRIVSAPEKTHSLPVPSHGSGDGQR